jgi:hypothetical protein
MFPRDRIIGSKSVKIYLIFVTDSDVYNPVWPRSWNIIQLQSIYVYPEA